jgi:inosose dehydratase
MQRIDRRTFAKSLAMAAAAAALPAPLLAAKKRKVQVGHTGITWPNREVETAITQVSGLGFYGFEPFSQILDGWEDKPGGLGAVLQAHNLPLISAYCGVNLTDPNQLKSSVADITRWAGLVKKYGGRVTVIGPNGVNRRTYVYADNKANIVAALNAIGQAVTDVGLTAVLHQHTGTCVESKDETYATLDAMNTKVMKFGPDIGQLTKGGADAYQVVKDYLPLVEHMHLKDWNGEDNNLSGYCPLGEGKVNIPGILDLMQKKGKISGMVMGELDDNGRDSRTPLELVTKSRDYLVSIGVKFRNPPATT